VQNVRKEQEEQGHLKSRVKVLEASLGDPIVHLYLRAEIDSFPGFGVGIWQTLQAKINFIASRAFMSSIRDCVFKMSMEKCCIQWFQCLTLCETCDRANQLAALKQNVDLIWPCTIYRPYSIVIHHYEWYKKHHVLVCFPGLLEIQFSANFTS